jgi:hypothetical protein
VRQTYRALAGLIALAVVVQAMAIAFGFFTVGHDVEENGKVLSKSTFDNGYEPVGLGIHGFMGFTLIPLLAIVLFIISFFAKVPGGVKWAGIVFGLTVLQVLLGFVSFAAPVLGLLHGLNAFALAAAAGLAGRGTRKAVTPEPTSPYGPGVAEA